MNKRTGKCLRCGRCCRSKMLWDTSSIFLKIIFFLLKPKALFKFKKFYNSRCPFVFNVKEKWICKQHNTRPEFCRNYPANKKDLIDNSCGFKFE